MKNKRILSFLLLVLTMFALALSLTSCSESVDDLNLPKQTTAILEYNYYEVQNLDKKTISEFDSVKYLSNDNANEYFSVEDAKKNLQYLVAGKKDDDVIIVCYCKSDEAAVAVTEKFKALKDSDSEKYADYSIDETVYIDVEEDFEMKIVCFATDAAVKSAITKKWTAKITHTFIDNNNYKYMVKGFGNTLLITLGALIIGVFLGVLVAVAKYYSEDNPKLKFLSIICDLYTTVIRGIPITVLLLIFFFIIMVSANGITVAIIAFGINSGAYMAELVRSGINAVDSGQMEAARSLGMSKWQAMRTIIFPQAIKNVLPAIGNECIALLKETSVAGYVAVVDLTRGANLIRNLTYDAFNPIILSALIYLTLVVIMTKLLSILERRLAKSDRRINKK